MKYQATSAHYQGHCRNNASGHEGLDRCRYCGEDLQDDCEDLDDRADLIDIIAQLIGKRPMTGTSADLLFRAACVVDAEI
jgi:hypothetical protein